jgi:hypothetical protein
VGHRETRSFGHRSTNRGAGAERFHFGFRAPVSFKVSSDGKKLLGFQ